MRRDLALLLGVLVLLAVYGRGSVLRADSGDPSLATDEAAIYALVFTRFSSDRGRMPVFVSVNGGDPSREILQRLNEVHPVRPVSECLAADSSLVQDSRSGAWGVLWTMGPIEWRGAHRATTRAGYHSGHALTYFLYRTRDEWRVEGIQR
ncbi:MAG: hypothetical protein FJX76_19180 [Armatimonadetes bacterium]|nr:hypothetical protein [Armatimonadota bacterium]